MARQVDLFADSRVTVALGVGEATSASLKTPRLGFGKNVPSVAGFDEAETLTGLLAHCPSRPGDPSAAARRLLARFGSLGRVFGAAHADLAREVGADLAAELGVLHALLLRILAHPLRRRSVISSWEAAKTYVRAHLGALPREAFHVLFLDTKNQLIADERMAEGSISHAPVYPREVVRRALELSAAAVMLVHNHPTGDPTPSKADIEMTLQVVAAAKPLGIAVHDHFIVGGDQVASLRSLGLM